MCYHRRNIINKTVDFNIYYDRTHFSVPCNNCAECKRLNNQDWFIRAYAEHQACLANGGCVVFITLTYNDIFLPQSNGFAHFDKTHIQGFIKRLKSKLTYYGYNMDGFKYLICSEFGSTTARPHYHGLLFFPFQISSYKLHNLKGNGYIDTCWPYGFNSFSKKGAFVYNPKGVEYVTKYISKQSFFFSRPTFKTWYSSLSKETRNNIKPFHLQSQSFGISLLNTIDDSQYFDNKFHVYGYDRTFSIPRYIQRKKLYDVQYTPDKKNCYYHLNSFGIEVMKHLQKDSVFEQDVKFYNTFDPSYLSSVLSSEDIKDIANDYHIYPSALSICNYFHNKLEGRSVNLLSTYMVVLKDTYISYDISKYSIYDIADCIFIERLNKKSCPFGGIQLDTYSQKSFRLQYRLYNDLTIFQGFDALLGLYNSILSKINTYADNFSQQKELSIYNIRTLFHSSIYGT